MKLVSKKLRNSARGEQCTLELYPHCNSNPETVIWAHLPSEHKGMGIKSPDIFGVYACSDCHDVIDGRAKTEIDDVELGKLVLRAAQRTLLRLVEKGLIKFNF